MVLKEPIYEMNSFKTIGFFIDHLSVDFFQDIYQLTSFKTIAFFQDHLSVEIFQDHSLVDFFQDHKFLSRPFITWLP